MSPWASPIVVVKKTPKCSPQQFHLCVDYMMLNFLLLAVTPAMGTKKGTFTLMPLPKLKVIHIIKKQKVLHSTLSLQWLLSHQVR